MQKCAQFAHTQRKLAHEAQSQSMYPDGQTRVIKLIPVCQDFSILLLHHVPHVLETPSVPGKL